jgi:hypothetical protein
MRGFRYKLLTAASAAMMALGGCATRQHAAIPSSAVMTVEGDSLLSFRAPQSGEIYVVEPGLDKLLYSGQIDAGETVTVDPEADQIVIGGRTVFENALGSDERRQIFFSQSLTPDRVVVPAGSRIEVQEAPPTQIDVNQQPDTRIRVNESGGRQVEIKEQSDTKVEVRP